MFPMGMICLSTYFWFSLIFSSNFVKPELNILVEHVYRGLKGRFLCNMFYLVIVFYPSMIPEVVESIIHNIIDYRF